MRRRSSRPNSAACPPAFLPVGNRRLFRHQAERLAGRADRMFLSVPDGFKPAPMDLEQLQQLQIGLVEVPGGLSLGESVVWCINVLGGAEGSLQILHGDTLMAGLDWQLADAVSVGHSSDNYAWASISRGPDGRIIHLSDGGTEGEGDQAVLTGWFHFADPRLLVQCITRARGRFIPGLALYVQQRPLTPLAGDWLDFGHLNTFYQSRSRLTTERRFNSLNVSPRSLRKSSGDGAKIRAEAGWYEQVPAELRVFLPQYLGQGQTETGEACYRLEYLHLTPLSDVAVFGRLPAASWRRIFEACAEFLDACAACAPAPDDMPDTAGLYGAKTLQRLERFAAATGLDLQRDRRINGRPVPGLRRMVEELDREIGPAGPELLGICHGDFCFSNILYDFRRQAVKVIDPRGLDAGGRPTIHGDRRYDIAKLNHSVRGRYDEIVAGYFRLRQQGEGNLELELPEDPVRTAMMREFGSCRFGGLTPAAAKADPATILLFLAMLPLHGEDTHRQAAFLANALRLYAEREAGA